MNKFSVFPEFVIFTKYTHELIKIEIFYFNCIPKYFKNRKKKKNYYMYIKMYKDFKDHLV